MKESRGNIILVVFYLLVLGAIVFSIYSFIHEDNDIYNNESLSMTIDSDYNINLSSNDKLYYYSNNIDVVKVNDNGLIKAVGIGNTTIEVKDGDGNLIQTIKIDVYEDEIEEDTGEHEYTEEDNKQVEVKSVSFEFKSLTLNVGETKKLNVSFNPNDASNKNLAFSSSDTSIIGVDSSGNITAKKEGTAIVLVKSNNGKTAKCEIVIKKENKEKDKEEDNNQTVIEVESISLDKKDISMYEGEVTSLNVNINPNNAKDKNLTYYSDNTSVASVDESGNIKAIKEGNAIITVTSNNGKVAKCNIKVIHKNVEVESVKLNIYNIEIKEKETYKIQVSLFPETATNKTVTYSSSDNSILSVDNNGNIKALKEGNAVITVKSSNGKTSNCNVSVKKSIIEVNSISLNKKDVSLKEGESVSLVASILPSNASNKGVTWSSSNTSVASVDANGKVTANKEGSAIITAKSSNLKTVTCNIKVTKKEILVESISLNTKSITLDPNKEYTLQATINPSTATNKTLTWATSDANVVKVNSYGKLTSISPGEATITVTSNNGKKATCKVIVPVLASSISLDKISGTINVGQSLTLSSTVSPSNATDRSVTWSSSNASIATVTSKGVVKGVGEGTVTITAKTSNNKTASASIKINHTTSTYCDYLVNSGVDHLDYKAFIKKFPNSDDYYAIKATHDCANKYNLPVSVTKGTYNIYKKTKGSIIVNTNTDFNNSTIYIHDESGIVDHVIVNSKGKKVNDYNDYIYIIRDVTSDGKSKCTNSTTPLSVNSNIKKGNIIKEFGTNNYVTVVDTSTNKNVYIRYGANISEGEAPQDSFRVDENGKIVESMFFDYNGKVNYTICPIPKKRLSFKNAEFITIINNNEEYMKFIGDGNGKIAHYLKRGISINRSKSDLSNLKHSFENSEGKKVTLSTYGYLGFFRFNGSTAITFKNSRVSGLKIDERADGNSTYDLAITDVTRMTIENLYMYDYEENNRSEYYKKTNQLNMDLWGVMGSNHSKNITFENCVLNRIDAHRGILNLNVNNSVLGVHHFTLTGKGTLNINNTEVRYSNDFIFLRRDYGSVWNGTVNINNSKIIPGNTNPVNIVMFDIMLDDNKCMHDYGYDLALPKLNINGFEVKSNTKNLYMFGRNKNYITTNTKCKNGSFSTNYYPEVTYNGIIGNNSNLKISSYIPD